MKEMGGIGRWALILLLLGNVYGGFAQDANTARAQHIYELFVAGQGDSIHAALNRELQEKLAPALFNDSFRQAEKMFGKSISKGEWKTDSAQGITIYYSDVEFERYNLRFLVAFDADGALNTIRLVPAPAVSTAQPVAYDKTKMDERDITLGADGYKLPGTLTLPKRAVGSDVCRVPCVILVLSFSVNPHTSIIAFKPTLGLLFNCFNPWKASIRFSPMMGTMSEAILTATRSSSGMR